MNNTSAGTARQSTKLPGDATLADLYREVLVRLEEKHNRHGLRTPESIERVLRFAAQGYRTDIGEIFRGALSEVECNDMVIVKDIKFVSICEHHLLPFFGKVHIGYLPTAKTIEIDSLARVVEAMSRRLQSQERLTKEIAEEIHRGVNAAGVGVILEARHWCTMMCGAEKQRSATITLHMSGRFRDENGRREEFLARIQSHDGSVF